MKLLLYTVILPGTVNASASAGTEGDRLDRIIDAIGWQEHLDIQIEEALYKRPSVRRHNPGDVPVDEKHRIMKQHLRELEKKYFQCDDAGKPTKESEEMVQNLHNKAVEEYDTIWVKDYNKFSDVQKRNIAAPPPLNRDWIQTRAFKEWYGADFMSLLTSGGLRYKDEIEKGFKIMWNQIKTGDCV